MYHWRVDTNGVKFRAASDPAPVVKDRKTGELATDRQTGETMFSVDLLVKAPESKAEVWTVKVAGRPEGVEDGMVVELLALVGQDWEVGDRHGISWRADAIVPATNSNSAPAPGPAPVSGKAPAGPPPPPGKAA